MFDRDDAGDADADGQQPPVGRAPDRRFARLCDMARSVGGAARSAGSTARAAGAVARTLGAPAGLRGLAVESAWCAAYLASYPLDLRRRAPGTRRENRTDALSLDRRSQVVSDLTAAGTAVLLLPGFLEHRSAPGVLRRALRRHGFGVVHEVDYGSLTGPTGDIRLAAHELRGHVERLRERTGADRVHIVGHSLGGVVARYYVQRLGGDQAVHTLVTLGSPHAGSNAAHLLRTSIARQLTPGSDLLEELAEPAAGCRTRFLVVWSRLDQLIVPARNARLTHPDLTVDTLELSDAGHLSLPTHPSTVRWVTGQLARSIDPPDPMGGTARRGPRPLSAVRSDAGRTPLTVR